MVLRLTPALRGRLSWLDAPCGIICATHHGVHGSDANYGWVAAIYDRGVHHHLGAFGDEFEAACAYDEAARRLKGSEAKTNFEE